MNESIVSAMSTTIAVLPCASRLRKKMMDHEKIRVWEVYRGQSNEPAYRDRDSADVEVHSCALSQGYVTDTLAVKALATFSGKKI